jgi:hypothetical protein
VKLGSGAGVSALQLGETVIKPANIRPKARNFTRLAIVNMVAFIVRMSKGHVGLSTSFMLEPVVK